jgi:TetR/AcrR family transcriptional regulator, transcriptional repressor for nem operon
MAKSKQFDPEQTLRKAGELFARHGYEGTSLALLTEQTGVAKQSLYDAFGDKRQLLSQCLAQSTQQFPPARALLKPKLSGRAALGEFFTALLADCGPESHGCLVSALLLEKAGHDADIGAEAAHYWQQSKQLLQATIARGQADGSIRNSADAALLAQLLMTWMSGLRVSARTSSVPELAASTQIFLSQVLQSA